MRVGSGNQTFIVNDACIPGSLNYRLISPVSSGNLEIVSDLINPISRVWREDIVTECFEQADAERTLRIPLAVEPSADVLVWMGDPSGEFSVKISYKLLHNRSYPPTPYILHHNY